MREFSFFIQDDGEVVARPPDFLPDGQITDTPVQPFLQKYSGSLLTQISCLFLAIPAQHRGAFRDRHERRVGMRWTQAALLTRALFLRTAKPCGPDAPTLASSLRTKTLQAKVARKPGHLGEREGPR